MGTAAPTPQQAKLAELVVNGVRDVHGDHQPLGGAVAMVLFSIAAGVGAGVLLLSCVRWAGLWLDFHVPDWVYYAVGMVPLALVVFFCKMVQFGVGETIEVQSRGGSQMIHFTRLDMTLGSMLLGLAFFLGVGLGTQTSLMSNTADHCGIKEQSGWWGYFALTLDNFFHGIVLWVSELYDLRLADRVDHSRWSATLFLAFRLSYDALVIFLILAFYHRGRVIHLMTSAPPLLSNPTPANLAEYLRAGCYGRGWATAYHDEFIFLCMVEKFLSGEYEECRLLGRMFPDVGIPAGVRALFVDPAGNRLL